MSEKSATCLLLIKARALIKHGVLTDGAMAATVNGSHCRPRDPLAVAFCPVGAILHLEKEFGHAEVKKALALVHDAALRLGEPSMGEFGLHRSHRACLKLFDAIIKNDAIIPLPKPRRKYTRNWRPS